MTYYELDGLFLTDHNVFVSPVNLVKGDTLVIDQCSSIGTYAAPAGRYIVTACLGDRAYVVRRQSWWDRLLVKLGVRHDDTYDSDLAN